MPDDGYPGLRGHQPSTDPFQLQTTSYVINTSFHTQKGDFIYILWLIIVYTNIKLFLMGWRVTNKFTNPLEILVTGVKISLGVSEHL